MAKIDLRNKKATNQPWREARTFIWNSWPDRTKWVKMGIKFEVVRDLIRQAPSIEGRDALPCHTNGEVVTHIAW